MAWYKVVAGVPVCVDYENGRVASFRRGMCFEADPKLQDIRRLLRMTPKPITPVGKPAQGGYPAPTTPTSRPPREAPNQKVKLPEGVHQLVRLFDR